MENVKNSRMLKETPFDHRFDTKNGEELCHATGWEVYIRGQWWNEYYDSEGNFHYGR